jgi:hypothetical protein
MKKHLPFSHARLLIVTLAFALIGAIILLVSHAAPNPNLPGDLNNDNTVNASDLSLLLTNFGTTNSAADINSDGHVNVLDMSILLAHYGQSVSTSPLPLGPLLFGDEFNGASGTKPDSSKWGAKSFSSSGSLAVWDGWNQISENGSGDVVITATKQSNGTWNTGWLSGKLGYSGKRYVEARVKIACGYGTWNGPIWEWEYPYGAGGLENDVIESLGKEPSTYHTTLHNWTVSPNLQSGLSVSTGQTLCNGFHTFAAAVYSDHVDYYLDGVKASTRLASAIGLTNLTSYEEVMNVSLNMGGWGGTPTIAGPVSITVDYVHAYQLL